MPILGQAKSSYPIAMRSVHYDAAILQPPVSIMAVIREPDVSYIASYNNKNYRQLMIQQGKMGIGNGGTIMSSLVFADSQSPPIPTLSFSFMPDPNMPGDFRVGWHIPVYEYDPADAKEPMWDKVSGYSIEVKVRDLKKVTKADAGTGSEDEVVFTFPVYGVQLVHDETAYDENGNLRQWVFYGVSNGIKGWYTASELSDGSNAAHSLLGPKHSDTVPSGPTKGAIIVGNSDNKWEKLPSPPSGNSYVLVSDSLANLGVSWKKPPSAKSISTSPQGRLTLTNDVENPGKNKYYGFSPQTGHGWYNTN